MKRIAWISDEGVNCIFDDVAQAVAEMRRRISEKGRNMTDAEVLSRAAQLGMRLGVIEETVAVVMRMAMVEDIDRPPVSLRRSAGAKEEKGGIVCDCHDDGVGSVLGVLFFASLSFVRRQCVRKGSMNKLRNVLFSSFLFLAACGGIENVDYTGAVHNCGGSTCGYQEACVTRGYFSVLFFVPAYREMDRCEPWSSVGRNSTDEYPYLVEVGGKFLTREEYMGLPEWQKYKDEQGALIDFDAAWRARARH